MGDPENPKPLSISLPPGCRFYPSEEQLLCYYLTHKNNKNDDRLSEFHDVINEIDLYGYNPFDLPDVACFRFGREGRKRHWYCFVAAARVSRKDGGRRRRRAGGGYWKSTGQVRDVLGGGGGKVVVGTRRSFVFYLGESVKTAVRTAWLMYEYALLDHHKDSFIVCRVFVKAFSRNNFSEHVVSSCGEGSVATVRHIGIQHDGAITSGICEGIVHDDNSVENENAVLTGSVGAAGALTGVQVPLGIQPDEQVTASELTSGASMFISCFAAHHLTAILEEDYIELDDLPCPLSDRDFT